MVRKRRGSSVVGLLLLNLKANIRGGGTGGALNTPPPGTSVHATIAGPSHQHPPPTDVECVEPWGGGGRPFALLSAVTMLIQHFQMAFV